MAIDDQFIFDREQLEEDPELADYFWADRSSINFGFRASPDMTTDKAAVSIFMPHCETTNIWTHIIALIYFATLFRLMLTKPGTSAKV